MSTILSINFKYRDIEGTKVRGEAKKRKLEGKF
ncbi:hypothetical protein ES705_18451 [subsurface metagenome]